MAVQTGLPTRYSPEFIFAHEFTQHYEEFAQYLPEFGRLRELSRICVLIQYLNQRRMSNKISMDALDYLLGEVPSCNPPDTELYNAYKKAFEKTHISIQKDFDSWRAQFSTSVLSKKIETQLQQIKNDMQPLTFDSNSREVQTIYTDYYNQLIKQNPGCSSAQILPHVPTKSKIASDLSSEKKKSWREQLYKSFSKEISGALGQNAYNKVIDSFMNGDIKPLAQAILNNNQKEIQQQIHRKQFPRHTLNAITAAIDDNGQKTAENIARDECRMQFKELQQKTRTFESGFANIGLGKDIKPLEVNDHIISWVPASVRHEVAKDENSGQTRYSFFVYGGVSLQSSPAYLYQKLDAQGNHLKFGITKNPDIRYTAAQMNGGKLNLVAQGSRQEMLKLERNIHCTLPIGPEERQRGYINIQAAKGYRVPPY